jgi:pimeloyl-ACP methyl ester carboxylesterase
MKRLDLGLLAFVALLTQVLAAPAYSCRSFFVKVPVANVTQVFPPFPFPLPDGYAVTSFANAATYRDPAPVNPKLQNVSGTFNISVEYCTPNQKGPKASTIQFLTHGLGFDKKYWDFRLPSAQKNTQYSYITTALANGYSTFSWDRLGCGLSTVPDPYLVVQAPIELTVLATLTGILRQGGLKGEGIAPPKKVIHVGHSWGSELSNALAALPQGNELSDGLILTAFSHQFQYGNYFIAASSLHLASTNQPARFGNRSTGYVTWGDKFANQYSFLEYPYFDPAVLEYAESTKFPMTIGELLTQGALNYNASTFKGPVLWLAAQRDLIFCQGDCVGLFNKTSPAIEAFSGSSDVEVYIQPNVGHGINLHKNATGAYNVAQSWAGKHGF